MYIRFNHMKLILFRVKHVKYWQIHMVYTDLYTLICTDKNSVMYRFFLNLTTYCENLSMTINVLI